MEEVKMEEMKDVSPSNKKFTYEELEGICHQLSEQNRVMYQKLQENIAFKRLDYLFSIIANREAFSKEFITSVVSEIEATMTIPEDNTTLEDSSNFKV